MLGLFGGAGATMLWELGLKPRRDRRALARLLYAELVLNRRLLRSQLRERGKQENPFPSLGYRAHTLVFASATARLAELPLHVAVLIYWTYRYFERAELAKERWWRTREASVGKKPEIIQDALAATDEIHGLALEHGLISAEKALSALEYVALPVWSLPRHSLNKLATQHAKEIAEFLDAPDL